MEQRARLVMQAAVIKQMVTINKDEKMVFAQTLEEGERLPVKTGDGVPLGSIWKTDPKPRAVVVDVNAVAGLCDPGEIVARIGEGMMGEALRILGEVAPELLDWGPSDMAVERLAGEALAAHKRGEATPGFEVRKPSGSMSVKPSDEAHALALGLAQVEALAMPVLEVER